MGYAETYSVLVLCGRVVFFCHWKRVRTSLYFEKDISVLPVCACLRGVFKNLFRFCDDVTTLRIFLLFYLLI